MEDLQALLNAPPPRRDPPPPLMTLLVGASEREGIGYLRGYI